MLRKREVGKGVAVPLNSAVSPCGSRPAPSVFFCNESPVPLSAISPLCSWEAEVFHLSRGWFSLFCSRVVGRREEGGYFLL